MDRAGRTDGPPPRARGGPILWMRENLFSSWTNAALTLLALWLTYQFAVTVLGWAVLDATWQGRGFNSRSEFIRHVLHDAVEQPTFDRDELLAIALGEREVREGRTHSREEILEEFGIDLEDE